MLKISIIQDGAEDAVFEVEGNEATIGRARDCDVVVPNVHVSGRHAKILSGLVVMDLKSTNATFIEGEKIQGAAVAPAGEFQLGGEVRVRVEDTARDPLADEFGVMPEMTVVAGQPSPHAELDEERRRNAKLQGELDEARRALEGVTPALGDDRAVTLEAENKDLARRLETLKGELERRDDDAAVSHEARLNQQALADVQKRNEELVAKLHAMEAQLARPDVAIAKDVLQDRVGELEAERANLLADVETLRTTNAELGERAEKAAEASPSEHFFALQAEIGRLRDQLAEAEAACAGDAAPKDSGDLHFELRQENERLTKELAEARRAAEGAGPDDAESADLAALQSELHAERMSKAEMLKELDDLRHKVGTAPAEYSVSEGSNSPAAIALIRQAARDDVDALEPDLGRPPVDFLAMELFRFMRTSERFITRLTGTLYQILDPSTIMPGLEKNLRELTLAVVESDDPGPRTEFLEYLTQLQRGMLVSEQAYRRSAERFAFELREELSERGLTSGDPIPRLKRLAGQAEGELWERAQKHLEELSDETVRDRVERFARDSALDLLERTQ
ncbi:MAG: FHA domain-containing protein [Planctomycetota bacterium]